MLNRFLRRAPGGPSTVVGIAVRDRYTAAVKLQLSADNTRAPLLLAAEVIPEQGPDSLAAALQQWVDAADAERLETTVVLPGSAYRLLQIDAPQVPEAELRQAASWAIRELIDYPLDQAVVDVFPPAQAVRRGKPQINVVAARRHTVCALADDAKAASLRLRRIDINEMAQRNLLARLPAARGGSGLLVLGENGGLLTLYRDEELLLARQIRVGLGLLERDMEQGANQLQLELQRSFDYYESTLGQPPLGALHVFPVNDDTDAFAEWASAEFASLTVRGTRLRDIVEMEGALLVQEDPGILLAVGAALGAPA